MHERAKRMRFGLFAVLLLVGAGCPGTLDDKERFEQGASSTATATSTSSTATGSGGAGGATTGNGGNGGSGG